MDQFKLEKEKLYADKNTDWEHVDDNLKYYTSNSLVSKDSGHKRALRSHFMYKKYGTPPMDRKFLHDPY